MRGKYLQVGCNQQALPFSLSCQGIASLRFRKKDRALKQSHETVAERPIQVRGCRVSAPIQQPWGGACRIVEWIDRTGQISRRVVAGDATAADVRATINRHVEGRKHLLYDDEKTPRQTLPRQTVARR
jgi:hypothetical protein